MPLNKTKYKASTTTVIIRLLTVWLSLSDYTESACIIINRDYIRPCIFHSPSRSMETLHLLHGCNGRSACEDHSNMLACSVARCWGGQSRAPAGNQERGETGEFLRVVMSLDRMSQFPSNHIIFSFRLALLRSPLFPLILAPRDCSIS